MKYGSCADLQPACKDAFVAELGRHVYRRPLAAPEVANLTRLFDAVPAGPDAFAQGARLVVAAMLQSPHFLYKLERVQAEPDNYEVATRLSYLLWKSGPDTALLDAASRGELSTSAGIETLAATLLQSPKAKRGVRAFGDDWLRLYTNLTRPPIEDLGLTPTALSAMREETLRFIERVLMDDQGAVAELLTNRVTEFGPELLPIYKVAESADRRYDLTSDPNRTGLLTQAAVLGNRAGPLRASLVDRGLTIVEEFLCIEIPPPPAAAAAQVADFGKGLSPTASEREKLKVHSGQAECVGCHSQIDPFAYAFENFNVAGAYSPMDEHGNALQGNGELTLDGVTQPYANIAEFTNILAKSASVQLCLTEKFLQYSLGRKLTSRDKLLLEHANSDSLTKGGKYAHWVSAVVGSEAFRNPAPEVEAL
jgi:hypothetical protein